MSEKTGKRPTSREMATLLDQLDARVATMTREIRNPHIALATARKASGLNQTEFAEKLGVSQSSVTDWERGRSKPRVDLRPKITQLLSLPEGFFENHSFRKTSMTVEEIYERAKTVLEQQSSPMSHQKPSFKYRPRTGFLLLFDLIYDGCESVLQEMGHETEPRDLAWIAATRWVASRNLLAGMNLSGPEFDNQLHELAARSVQRFRESLVKMSEDDLEVVKPQHNG